MGEYKSGELKRDVMLGLAPGLLYLDKTGTDIDILDITERKRVTYKRHGLFKWGDNMLPKPYIDGDNVISREFMINYDLVTKVDLARYIRIISIILSEFTGPKEADHLESHVLRLKVMLKKERNQREQERAMRVCLLAYEQHLGKRSDFHHLFKEQDYINFIRVLNSRYDLYEVYKPSTISKNDIKIDPLKIGWLEQYKELTDEEFISILNRDIQRENLFNFLKRYNIYLVKSEKDLKSLINNDDERAILLKKILDYCKKEWNPEE